MDAWDQLKIAAEAKVDPRTVRKAYEGGRVFASTRQAIARAAQSLGLEAPPEAAQAGAGAP